MQLDRKVFLALFVAYMILFAPIILVGRPLLDDMRGAIWGLFWWSSVGRPLGDLLFGLLNLGGPTVATYLLNQFIAISCLAAAGTILAALFTVRNPLLAALVLLPLAGHPYFLENISYSFDSPLMASAVLAAVASASVTVVSRGLASSLVAVLLLGGSLCLYQPAANLFFLICAFFLAKHLLNIDGHPPAMAPAILRRALGITAVAGVLYSSLVYYRLDLAAYAVEHAAVPALADVPAVIARNIFTYWRLIWRDWGATPLLAFLGLTLILGSVALYLDPRRRLPRSPGLVFLSIGLLFAAFVLQWGFLLLLKNPIWSPRTFITFGIFPTLAGLQALSALQARTARISRGAVLVFLFVVAGLDYSLLVVADATGAAALAQKTFETSLTSRIMMDLEQLSGVQQVAIVGIAPSSPVLLNTARKFPIMPRVVQNPLADDWYWGYVLLRLNGVSLEHALGYADKIAGRPPTLTRRSYRIFVLDKTAIIDFRR